MTSTKILVPTDFSDTSLQALDHAIYVAKLNKATITLIHVFESAFPHLKSLQYPDSVYTNLATYEKEILKQGKDRLNKLVEKIRKKNSITINAVMSTGWIKEDIIQTSEKIKADIIIMGTHGVKGVRELIIGSNTFRVVNEAKCPVLSIRDNGRKPGIKNIVLPFRDKPHSREKVDYAIRMGEIFGATIHVLGIDTDEDKEHYKKIELEAKQIKGIVEKHGLTCNIKVKSSSYLSDKVLKYASKKNADLIVIMSDLDRMNISEFFMGPFSQQIVNHSPIPVLSIRPTFNPNTIDLHGYGW